MSSWPRTFPYSWRVSEKVRLKRPLNPFNVYRNGDPITAVQLRQSVKTGIEIMGLVEGVVPELEEREAALFCGYTWKEWQNFSLLDPIDRYERAAGVAFRRMHILIEQHVDDAVNSEMERKARTKRNA
jgi:hypothetical protein